MMKVLNIGDWDMDADFQASATHGLDHTTIRWVGVMIRNDANTIQYQLAGRDSADLPAQVDYIDDTNIGMSRNAGKFFDSVDFDSTSYNRGWTTLFFVNE